VGLRRALVDRARVVRRVPTGPPVEGTTPFGDAASAWFLARLIQASIDGEANGNQPGRTRVPRTPQLLYGLVDESGAPIVVHADDRVEVDSAELGSAVWQVNGEPQPLRKRKVMLGGLADLVRVEEPGRD
jgi:hypothetical protein